MIATDNLTAAVAGLTQKFTDFAQVASDHAKAVDAEVAAIKDALATNDTAAIQAAADNINQLTSTLDKHSTTLAAETQQLADSLPKSTPTPTP